MSSKLRKAIQDVVDQIEMEYGESVTTKIIKEFLSKPIRNCEVGTADEQFKRHSKWCARKRDFSCATTMCRKCFASWAQMPYEEVK